MRRTLKRENLRANYGLQIHCSKVGDYKSRPTENLYANRVLQIHCSEVGDYKSRPTEKCSTTWITNLPSPVERGRG